MPKYPKRECENPACINAVDGKPKMYTPTRRWQRFCEAKCGDAYNNSRLVRKRPTKGAGGRSAGCNTHLSARRPWNLSLSLVEAKDGFQTIYGKPRNFGGELTRLAMSKASAPVILRLAAAERNSEGRVCCRTCELHCEDGVACPRLGATPIQDSKFKMAEVAA